MEYQRQHRILVVDDDPTTRYMTCFTLEQIGFHVFDVETGKKAVDNFIAQKHDVVLLDVGLPDMDGFAVCEKIRQSPEGLYTPIVMITGLDDIASVEKAYDVGATDFIVKPINWTILGHRVKYITRASDTFQGLQQSQQRLTNAKDVAGIAEWTMDLENNQLTWSNELHALLRIPLSFEPASHEDFLKYVHEEDLKKVKYAFEALHQSQIPYDIEYRIVREDKNTIFIHEHAKIFNDENERAALILGTLQDISKLKNTEAEVKYLAYYDSLTGLPNRDFFKDQLRNAILQAKRLNANLGIISVDLDQVNLVNDSLGHHGGDQLIKTAAERLLSCLRESDYISRPYSPEAIQPVARFGGDEFIVLIRHHATPADLSVIVGRLIKSVETPALIDNHEVPMSVSIGIAIYPRDGDSSEKLIKNAASALSHAKQMGKNSFRFYDTTMNDLALQKLTMARDLKKGLDNDEFFLEYQPKYNIQKKCIEGAEALIRWQHPSLGLIPPIEFIPLAEETNMIREIGEWLIKAACNETKKWHDMGFNTFQVAINLSPRQCADDNLLTIIENAVKASDLSPKHIEFELTESNLMADTEANGKLLGLLKAMGFNLAIDDFGTGYSSFRYLSVFPLDTLKIDRMFIQKYPESKHDKLIVQAIVALAHGMGMAVVTEGVETASQFEFIQSLGCEMAQGLYFHPPLSADALTKVLKTSSSSLGTAGR